MRWMLCVICLWFINFVHSQVTREDSLIVSKFYEFALSDSTAYRQLAFLCKKIGGRVTGSPQLAAAIEYTYQIMMQMPFDTVIKQPVEVITWRRGPREEGIIHSPRLGSHTMHVCALGGSVATPSTGIFAPVVRVQDIDELNKLADKQVVGKIVYFAKSFNPIYLNPYAAYGETARNRVHGAAAASQKGAAAVIVRSLTQRIDTFPHTGVVKYGDAKPIPAFAISTADAVCLDSWLKMDPDLNIYLYGNCESGLNVIQHNVIGVWKGYEYPAQIITLGCHLDAWDLGEGAHDDGVGCIQVIEAARLLMKAGYKPRNTLHVVMFIDEEINQSGSHVYASYEFYSGQKHYFAIESDRGGFTPYGFTFDVQDTAFFRKISRWSNYLRNYGLWKFDKGYGGVDIYPLKKFQIPLAGLFVDYHQYFDYQHSSKDLFETVHFRTMQLGSAAIAALIYFIDKYGYE